MAASVVTLGVSKIVAVNKEEMQWHPFYLGTYYICSSAKGKGIYCSSSSWGLQASQQYSTHTNTAALDHFIKNKQSLISFESFHLLPY